MSDNNRSKYHEQGDRQASEADGGESALHEPLEKMTMLVNPEHPALLLEPHASGTFAQRLAAK